MMKQCLRIALCGMLMVGLFISPISAQKQALVVNTTSTDVELKLFQLLMQEIGVRLGLDVTVQTGLSGERAIQDANAGKADGDGLRMPGLSETFPDIIQVTESFMETEWSAFSKDPKIALENWASLKPYRVGYPLGWKFYDKNVTGAKTIQKVKDTDALFKMLANDRIDLALFTKMDGMAYLKGQNLPEIRPLEPPLAVTGAFFYLHKKHAELAPKIAETLQAMKADGTYQKLFDRSLVP